MTDDEREAEIRARYAEIKADNFFVKFLLRRLDEARAQTTIQEIEISPTMAADGMQEMSDRSQTTVEPTEAEVNQAILVAGEVADLYRNGDRMPWLPVVEALVAARKRTGP